MSKKTNWLNVALALSGVAVVVTWLNTKPFRGMSQEDETPPPPPTPPTR